jgi:teichuronic acid biosynthesis glycosyltransferase TuaC
MGLWVQGLVRQSARSCELKVISPVPYCPPLPGMPENYSRLRRVHRKRHDGAIEILHPRFVLGPGYSTHRIESQLYYAGIRRTVAELWRSFRFDLIHAHFTYPDGVVAARLGKRYGVPVVITEQNPWGPWMNRYADVCRKAIWAAQNCACHIAISHSVRRTIEQFAGKTDNLVVIPDGVEGSEFTLPSSGARRIPGQILFVGAIRPVKGVDILLNAVRLLVDRGVPVNLVLVGEAFFGPYRREEERLRRMTVEMGLQNNVRFAGKQPLNELVRYMQESSALVLPSRAESLGMVLVESLACGTPVVATRCGGPEDIVDDRVGILVPTEDPAALAQGIEDVLSNSSRYDAAALRAHALERFGLESVGRRLIQVYRDAVAGKDPARVMEPVGGSVAV